MQIFNHDICPFLYTFLPTYHLQIICLFQVFEVLHYIGSCLVKIMKMKILQEKERKKKTMAKPSFIKLEKNKVIERTLLSPDTRNINPDDRHLRQDTRHLTPDTRHLLSDTRHLATDIRHLAADSRDQTPESPGMTSGDKSHVKKCNS